MHIYAGNVSQDVTEGDLRKEFSVFGEVTFVNLVRDRIGGMSRGFGFLGMSVESEAKAAIVALNGKQLKGKALIVHAVQPRSLNGPAPGPASS